VGLPVAAVVPDDRRGAAVLAGRAQARWGLSRLELLRAARALALSLHAEFHTIEHPTRPTRLHPVPPVIGMAKTTPR
jgi:hypothetical protein